MKQIYIVIQGGCLRYVSTTDRHAIKNLGITLLDLDEMDDDEADPEDLKAAEAATRIW